MKNSVHSLLDCRHLNRESLQSLVLRARDLNFAQFQNTEIQLRRSQKIVALVFFEPSTRTSCSFEIAALKLGYRVINLGAHESSLQKGETLLDTLLNLQAMGPSMFVVRHGGSERLSEIRSHIHTPIVSAGEGVAGHPTQALLDLYTIWEARNFLPLDEMKERILFVGDVAHSRVARSNFEVLKNLGFAIGISAPREWVGNLAQDSYIQLFDRVEEGLKWATCVVGLRVQSERHPKVHDEKNMSLVDHFIQNFQINSERLKLLSEDGIVMHPGPVNWGVELSEDVARDPRTKILRQVENGVRIRASVIEEILGRETWAKT